MITFLHLFNFNSLNFRNSPLTIESLLSVYGLNNVGCLTRFLWISPVFKNVRTLRTCLSVIWMCDRLRNVVGAMLV